MTPADTHLSWIDGACYPQIRKYYFPVKDNVIIYIYDKSQLETFLVTPYIKCIIHYVHFMLMH